MPQTKPTGPIAILGATSQIAKDFILQAHNAFAPEFLLYARSPEKVEAFLAAHQLRHPVFPLSAFGQHDCAAILHFVGVGDPARAKSMGAEIFDVTLATDQQALAYVAANPATRYVFMSSGAVYGTDYEQPVNDATAAVVPLNDLQPQHYYGVAKLYAEARHRALPQNTIIDLRIFSYISRSLDLGTRFLMADLANALRNKTVFRTDDQEIYRDFLHPSDFCQLIQACLTAPPGTNQALDVYSLAPIGKKELLRALQERFGLKVEITPSINAVHATGRKPYYYSESRRAEALGYRPRYTSRDAIVEEMNFILAS